MRCIFRGATPTSGASLYRVNKPGEPGVWACSRHIHQTDTQPDPETVKIVEGLGGKAPA